MESTRADTEAWPRERLAALAQTICDPPALNELLRQGALANAEGVRDTLFEAARARGLAADQVAVLLCLQEPGLREQVKATARQVHEHLFARRVRLSNPVCPNNRCLSDCGYCPLRHSNPRLRRSSSTPVEFQREVTGLLEDGHRHLTLVLGDGTGGLPYLRGLVEAAFAARAGTRRLRRLDFNFNLSSAEELQAITENGHHATYHVYQETYDPTTYARVHPDGVKADYEGRLAAHDRACAAGLRDLGLGVLLGLYDCHFDVLAAIEHARYLQHTYQTGALSISYPRLLATPGAPASMGSAWTVDDEEFTYLVAVTRLAMPLLEIVLNTPAPSQVRRELYAVGISQVAVGSLSYPGVYTANGDPGASKSLTIGRPRNLETLVYRMCEVGFVPNFCVDCYSQTRQHVSSGDHYLDRHPVHRTAANSLLALQEYLLDQATPATRDLAAGTIQEELARLPHRVREQTLALMEEAEAGIRGQQL